MKNKPTLKPVNASAAARTTKPMKKARRTSPLADLRLRLKTVERERDNYARELKRRLAKEVGAGDVNEEELYTLLQNGSGVSLESIIRDIAHDAGQ